MSARSAALNGRDNRCTAQLDPRKKYEELVQLKNTLANSDESSVNPGERFAKLQRLRNESQELRLHLSSASTDPSLEDITRLQNFASNQLYEVAKDHRGPNFSLNTANKTFAVQQQSPAPAANRVRSTFVPAQLVDHDSERVAEQNRLTSTLEAIDKRLDRIETTFNLRLDRMDNTITSLGLRIDRVEDNNSRSLSRMEDQYAGLGRKIESIDDRNSRPSIPPVVTLNLTGITGLISQLGNMQVTNTPDQPSSSSGATTSFQSQGRPNSSDVSQPGLFGQPPKSIPVSSQPMTVNVPKSKPAAALVDEKSPNICSPTGGSAENKSSTVHWGAPKPQIFAPKTEEAKLKPETTSTSSAETKKPTFSGFSGFSPSTALNQPPPEGFKGMFSGSAGANPVSFRSLAQAVPAAGFNKDPAGFVGSGQKLFGASAKDAKDEEDGDDEGDADEFVPKVDFKPVVQLAEVKVVTGEEGYDVLFRERSKLFRYDNGTKEWKERGLGDMTLQRTKVASADGRFSARVLMRWEKTFKICANHSITSEIKMAKKTDTVVAWYANDYAEGETKLESFNARFKTKDQADRFLKTFEELQAQSSGKGSTSVAAPPAAARVENQEPQSLSDMFKPKTGTWNCESCYVSNDAGKAACAACGTAKAGSVSRPSSSTAPAAQAFSFGYQPTASLGSQENKTDVKPFSGFASNSSAFSFGTPTKDLPKPAVPHLGGFSFGALGGPGGFKFDLNQPAPESPKRQEDDESDNENNVEDERSDLIFEPVVRLPDNVELKTGEENEMEIYCQRAKLFRYDQGEWKERGLGDLRMLKDENSAKVRLLMRRERILKVCCNHSIRPDMVLKPMGSAKNAWVWDANDFSEGVSEHQTFAIRFKHEVHALEFKKLFERAQRIVSGEDDVKEPFERVQVDERETLAPIAESGKKAIEMMSVNNPFENSPKSSQNPGPDEATLRKTLVGDKVYQYFGVIHDGKGAVASIFVPNNEHEFLKLNKQSDLSRLIAASSASEEAFNQILPQVTTAIDLHDVKSIPEAVSRYIRANKVKDIMESELATLPVFSGSAQLFRKDQRGQWKNLEAGNLRILPSDFDVAGYVYFCKGNTEDLLSSHCIAGDAQLKMDQPGVFLWTGMEETLDEEPVFCQFRAVLANPARDSQKFGQHFREAIDAAVQQEIFNGSDE